jgi:FeS assembly SUF system protein
MTTVSEEQIIAALRTVYDPELPVSVYELGLIYGVELLPDGDVSIRMTLTAPNCPAAQILPAQVAARVEAVPGVRNARVEVVFDPPWDQSRMSEAAKLELGLGLLQL